MNSTIILKTANNLYLYDIILKEFTYCYPIVKSCIEMYDQNSLNKDSQESESINLIEAKYSDYSRAEIIYWIFR